MAGLIQAAADAQSEPWAALIAGCEVFMKESQSADYQRVILVDGPSVLGTKKWQELDDRYTTSSLEEVLVELRNRGEISVPDAQAAAVALAGAMNQLSRWIAEGHQIEAARKTVLMLLQALKSPN